MSDTSGPNPPANGSKKRVDTRNSKWNVDSALYRANLPCDESGRLIKPEDDPTNPVEGLPAEDIEILVSCDCSKASFRLSSLSSHVGGRSHVRT